MRYDSLDEGITIEATLQRGKNFVSCDAKIDTGSQFCVFSREIGEELGIEIENGLLKPMGSVTGYINTYGHEITLHTLGLTFHTLAYFSEVKNLPRNLLGRVGWLQLIRLAIIDYDQELYLSNYDETD